MNIVSLAFVVFFATVAVAYYLISHNLRITFILAASLLFYYLDGPFGVAILISSIIFNYFMVLQLERQSGRKRQLLLWMLIICNVSLLSLYKLLLSPYGGVLNVGFVIPIGVSFYTFTQLSYIIDVHKGTIKAERDFGLYALYVSFFPKLIAGPIERAGGILQQFRQRISFDSDKVAGGLKLVLFGFFKKVVVAELLSKLVSPVYGNVALYSGPDYVVATILYSFQLLYDFSAYTDIAMGTAKVLGFELSQNFRLPYLAKSISDFWRRWHITLSFWFRDYLYIPLGGNRVPLWRRTLNIFAVFIAVGLWHGFAMTFLLWGALHGLYLSAYSSTKAIRERLSAITGISKRPE